MVVDPRAMTADARAKQAFDIFLSIATDDEAAGRRFEAFLESRQYRTFLALNDLGAVVGTRQWSEALEGVLAECPVLVLLVTRASLASKWVSFEWRSFHDDVLSGHRAGLLVPVLLEDIPLETLPAALRHWQIVNDAALDENKAHVELLRIIEGFRRATQSSAAPLERRLRWSLEPLSGPVAPATEPPPSPRSRRLSWITLAAAAAAGGLLVAAWRAPSNGSRPPAQAPSAPPSLAPPVSGTPPPPREVWQLLDQYASPSPASRWRLSRVETWREAASTLERHCRAAGSLADSPRAAAQRERCGDRHLSALELVKGERARLDGELAAAQTAFTAARRLDPRWPLPALALAATLTRTNPEQAREQARQAYELDRSLWLALTIKANTFIEQQRYVEAAQELNEAAKLAPADARPLVEGALALAYHSEGLFETKATALARASCTETARVAAGCTVLAEQALEARAPDEALRVAELADRDDFVPLLLAIGDAWQLKGRLPKAWPAWRRAVSLAGRADQEGVPTQRMAAIERAVQTNVPPPLRGAPERTRPGVMPKSDRSRPAAAVVGERPKPARPNLSLTR